MDVASRLEAAGAALALAPRRAARAVAAATAAAHARGHLPVAGLDTPAATLLLARLRAHDAAAADAWLHAYLLAQVAADAVVDRLAAARSAHAFWAAALADGAHGAHLLARCGPVVAARAAADAAAEAVARFKGAPAPPAARAPTARIEARVTALARARAELAAALGRLHSAGGAGALWLGDDDGEPPPERGVDGAALAARARAAADAAAAAVVAAVTDADAALNDARRAMEGGDGGAAARSSSQPPPGLPPLAAAAAALGTPVPPRAAATPLPAALAAARAAAAVAPPLPPLPPSLAAPSRAARAWLPLTGAALASFLAARFLFAHSRLAGSSDLDDWCAAARDSIAGSFQAHVSAPLDGLRKELVATLRDRPAPAVDAGAAASDRAALDRMLASFNADAGVPAPADPWGPLTAAYEAQLRAPLRSLAAGDLARCLLIQIQQLRVGTAGALAELDQILRANELTLAVAGALPALALVYVAGRATLRALAPAAPDPRAEAAPTRLAFAAAEAALARLARHPGDATAAGELAADLDAALAAATALFARRRAAAAAEAAPLRADVVALAAPAPPTVRAASAARAARTFAVLRP